VVVAVVGMAKLPLTGAVVGAVVTFTTTGTLVGAVVPLTTIGAVVTITGIAALPLVGAVVGDVVPTITEGEVVATLPLVGAVVGDVVPTITEGEVVGDVVVVAGIAILPFVEAVAGAVVKLTAVGTETLPGAVVGAVVPFWTAGMTMVRLGAVVGTVVGAVVVLVAFVTFDEGAMLPGAVVMLTGTDEVGSGAVVEFVTLELLTGVLAGALKSPKTGGSVFVWLTVTGIDTGIEKLPAGSGVTGFTQL
jgi:hypothetical protein